MTLTQLIEEAESDEDLGFRKRLRRIKGHLLDILNLTGFSNQTIHMMKRLNRFKIQLRDLGTIHQLMDHSLVIL